MITFRHNPLALFHLLWDVLQHWGGLCSALDLVESAARAEKGKRLNKLVWRTSSVLGWTRDQVKEVAAAAVIRHGQHLALSVGSLRSSSKNFTSMLQTLGCVCCVFRLVDWVVTSRPTNPLDGDWTTPRQSASVCLGPQCLRLEWPAGRRQTPIHHSSLSFDSFATWIQIV